MKKNPVQKYYASFYILSILNTISLNPEFFFHEAQASSTRKQSEDKKEVKKGTKRRDGGRRNGSSCIGGSYLIRRRWWSGDVFGGFFEGRPNFFPHLLTASSRWFFVLVNTRHSSNNVASSIRSTDRAVVRLLPRAFQFTTMIFLSSLFFLRHRSRGRSFPRVRSPSASGLRFGASLAASAQCKALYDLFFLSRFSFFFLWLIFECYVLLGIPRAEEPVAEN